MRTTLIRAAHRAVVLPLILVGIGPLCRVAQPQILRWEVEATVVEFFDPDSIFPNVHLGDPVRGVISYDLATAPNNNDPNNTKYQHTTPFEVVEMAIDNPRDGSSISFVADPARHRGVQVLNNLQDEFVGLYDNVFFYQGILRPAGYTGHSPMVGVDLYGPPETIAGTSLPVTLDLNDWPGAQIYFADFFDLFDGFVDPAGYVFADIHTLTPVVLPPVPGDYNANGKVDAADYVTWRDMSGQAGAGLAADGNADGFVNQDDYLFWRTHFGNTAGSGSGASASAAVPEPTTFLLLLFAATGWGLRRGRAAPNRRM